MVLLAIYKLYQVYINVYQFLFGVNINYMLYGLLWYYVYNIIIIGLAQLVTFFLTASNGLPRDKGFDTVCLYTYDMIC